MTLRLPRTTRSVVDEDTTAEVDALANDGDVDGDVLRILAVTVVEHPEYRLVPASVAFNQRRILVEPEPDQFGEVLLEYTIADPSGATAKATVLVRFDSANDSPVAVADSAVLVENTASRVDVLANDLDVDGDVLAIVSIASVSGGTATMTALLFVSFQHLATSARPDSRTRCRIPAASRLRLRCRSK